MMALEDAVRRNAFLTSVIGWWRNRRLTDPAAELGSLDDHELGRIAEELGVTRGDLVALAAEGNVAGRLMERMLASHAIMVEIARRDAPAAIREMEIECTRCRSKARCVAELDAGTAAAHAEDFCPNARAIQALIG